MKKKIECNWKDKMAFEAEVDGFKIVIDAAPEVGGENKGPRPKPLLLVSLAGCTGMDVVSILKKMRVELEDLNITVEGEQTDEHPKTYKSIHITYKFKGNDLAMDKLEKAVNLSQERYCGVSALLSKGAEITHEIKVI